MASKIPLDVLNRKKRYKAVDLLLRRARHVFDSTLATLKQYPEISAKTTFQAEILRLRNKFEFGENAITGYVRDEARFARYGSLEIKTESVEDLLQKCEAEIHELYDDVQRFQADFVDMSEGFKRRIKLLHMKLKRLRAGYVNVAKRRVADAKAMLRSKPPQLGGIPAVQDALQRCEGCVSAMSTILEMTTIDLLSEDSFNNQMRAIIARLDSKQHDLDAADRDLSVAVDKAMDAIGGLVEKVAAARQSQAAAAEAVAQVAALAEPSKKSSFDPESPWVERWDGQGNTYYENIKTGLTQWERPPGFGAVPPSGASQDTNSTTQAQPHKPTHKQTDPLDVLCSGEQLREDDSIASILQEAQRYAHVGQGAMSKVKPVDDLVLGDNSVVKVNDIQRQRAFHFLATGEVLGPRKLKEDALRVERARRRAHLDEQLAQVAHYPIGELKGMLEARRCRATGQRFMLEKRLRQSITKEWEVVEAAVRKDEDQELAENGDLVSSGRGDAAGGAVSVQFEDAYDEFTRQNPHLSRPTHNTRTDPFYVAAKAHLRKVKSSADVIDPSSSGRELSRMASWSAAGSRSQQASPKSKGCVVQ